MPTPTDQRIGAALGRAADSFREHGATPEQAAAMAEISRIVIESGDPSGAARQFLGLIAAGHQSWCKPDACDGTEHYGEANTLRVPEGQDIGVPHLLSSQLYVDSTFNEVHLWVSTGNPNDDEMSFDGPQADAFLDSVQRWIDQGRAQRAQIESAAVRADRAINEQVARQHPHVKPITDRPTSVCVYDGRPAVSVRTGQLGNRYGLCADCAECTATMDAAEKSQGKAAR